MPKNSKRKKINKNKKQTEEKIKQPDFTKIFFDFFGSKPKKVTYIVRQGPNKMHDMQFLSSLIHDGRFKLKNIILKNKNLKIPIKRECYELPIKHEKFTFEPHITDSILSIAPVQKIEKINWNYKYIPSLTDEEELVKSIWVDSPDDEGILNLTIETWRNLRLVLKIADEKMKIKLEDIEKPYLLSER